MTTNTALEQAPSPEEPTFARWDADDALDALHLAGLDIDHVEQARWPANAPQPRTQRQAYTFRSPTVVDPHLLLVFDSFDALEAWRLWLARYWRARPYISIRDNVLLLVSRELSETEALRFHAALDLMGTVAPRLTAVPGAPDPGRLYLVSRAHRVGTRLTRTGGGWVESVSPSDVTAGSRLGDDGGCPDA